MKSKFIYVCVCFGLFVSSLALADNNIEMIASAESAAPIVVTSNATIKAPDGTVLRKGSKNYTYLF